MVHMYMLMMFKFYVQFSCPVSVGGACDDVYKSSAYRTSSKYIELFGNKYWGTCKVHTYPVIHLPRTWYPLSR